MFVYCLSVVKLEVVVLLWFGGCGLVVCALFKIDCCVLVVFVGLLLVWCVDLCCFGYLVRLVLWL